LLLATRRSIGAEAHTEGSQLGLYLRSLKNEDRERFDQLMEVPSIKIEAAAEAVEEAVVDDEDTDTTVLIAVISSRENFKSRAASITRTWGESGRVPEGVTIRFFVGVADEGAGVVSGSEEDIANLARDAGIMDQSMVVVMTDAVDDEYPPVRKNSAMIRHLEDIVTAFENDATAPSTFQWIFKVDDDAYVHFDGLLKFVKKRNPEGYQVFGERGYGRKEDLDGLSAGGLVKPYCTGGPGYVFSRATLKRTAPGMDDCVQNADSSPFRQYLWHSDTVIGMCIQKQTDAGCWSDEDYNKNRVFRNNYRHEDPFVEDEKLPIMVSMHPFKDESAMQKHHDRFMKLKAAQKQL
jgi:hypothetical protein